MPRLGSGWNGSSQEPIVPSPCWRSLLENPQSMAAVPDLRGFREEPGLITWKLPRTLNLAVRLELATYRTEADRLAGSCIDQLCSYEVHGCTDGKDWQSDLLSRTRPGERELRQVMKAMIPLSCVVTMRLRRIRPDASLREIPTQVSVPLRIGIVVPGMKDVQMIRTVFGRKTSPGRATLFELWPPREERNELLGDYEGYLWALRVKLAQLIDRSFGCSVRDDTEKQSAECRLQKLLEEEAACVSQHQQLLSSIAQAEAVIEDSETVDLWLPEDAEEPKRRRIVSELVHLEIREKELRAVEQSANTKAQLDDLARRLWHARSNLGRLEAVRVSRRRTLAERIRRAKEEILGFQARLKPLPGRSDLLFLEREGIRALLNPPS